MDIEIIEKEPFAVIGKEGSTKDGPGFIEALWHDANAHFDEVAPLAARTADGTPLGFWGAMTDFSRSFRPWEKNFTEGLYLAGVECRSDAEAPAGWTKWNIPGFRFVRVSASGGDTFVAGLRYLSEHGFSLAGAVQDFTDPRTGENSMCFPIARL